MKGLIIMELLYDESLWIRTLSELFAYGFRADSTMVWCASTKTKEMNCVRLLLFLLLYSPSFFFCPCRSFPAYLQNILFISFISDGRCITSKIAQQQQQHRRWRQQQQQCTFYQYDPWWGSTHCGEREGGPTYTQRLHWPTAPHHSADSSSSPDWMWCLTHERRGRTAVFLALSAADGTKHVLLPLALPNQEILHHSQKP